MLLKIVQPPSPPYLKKYGQSLCLQFYDGRNPLFPVREYLVLESPYSQGHPTRNFDEIFVRESLLVLRLSDNAFTKSD